MTLLFMGIIVSLLFYIRSLQDKLEQLDYLVFDLNDTLSVLADDLRQANSEKEAAVMANRVFKEHHDELKEELVLTKTKLEDSITSLNAVLSDNERLSKNNSSLKILTRYANEQAVFYDQINDTITQGENLIFIGEL